MKKVEGWKAGLFVGSLSLIAIAFSMREANRIPSYSPQRLAPPQSDSRPQITFQPPEESVHPIAPSQNMALQLEKERRDKEEAHARYITRNVNPGFSRKAIPSFAVVAATPEGKLNSALISKLVSRLATNGLELIPSYFTSEFVADGNLRTLADGSNELIADLELSKVLDGVVLAWEEIAFETSPELQNLVTASLDLHVSIIRFTDHNNRETFVWHAKGPGFRKPDAQLAAEERIMTQVARDAKFTLMPSHPQL